MKADTEKERTMDRDSLRELDYRENDSISVSLLWNPANDHLSVVVDDDRAESFPLAVGAHRALGVFQAPVCVCSDSAGDAAGAA